ncbi:hypothetical protein LUZ63_019798 [Rhynchospora breviuscula]|uniref:Pectinesterase inhibitor domain-containing protein n=1 Tax=Rhynchospora breviuscula TaxID=2022672 RepID=A0A9Q0HJU4_9POAL|nr:hypothetical protein LUZ63_019798 [Rhynchospora breviuscula]
MEASVISFVAVLFLFSYSLAVSANIAKVDEVCNNLEYWYITPQVCHSVLDTDPQSRHAADINGVGVIAANIVAKNAAQTLVSVRRIASATSDPKQKKQLVTCVSIYTNISFKLNAVVASIKSRKYSAALEVMGEAIAVPMMCYNAVTYDNLKKELDRVGIQFSTVVSVGQAVVNYISR